MSNQSKVTTYYSRKRKARDDAEPSAKRKRIDTEQRSAFLGTSANTLEPPNVRSTRSTRSKASETLDSLFGEQAKSEPAESAAPCELFAPKVSYHGRARRNVGSVLSLAHKSRAPSSAPPKEADREWFKPVDTAAEEARVAALTTAVPASSASSKYASLAVPLTLSAKRRLDDDSRPGTVPKLLVPVQTKGQVSASSSSSTDEDLLPSTRLQRLAEPIRPVSDAGAKAAKLSAALPLPLGFRRLQEKMEATDNLLCLQRQSGGSFTHVREGVQRMLPRKDYTTSDLARITTVLPPAYILTQEKVEKDYELHIQLNGAWKEDLRLGRVPTTASRLPSGPQQVFQLKSERKDAFRERLLSRVHNEHQRFLGDLNMSLEEGQTITHWHPKFKLDSVPSIPCAELPKPPYTKTYSSASEVLKQTSVKSEQVSRALQSVAAASESKEAAAASAAKSPDVVALQKATLTPPPTPCTSDSKTREKDMKGIPSSLLEKIRKREAENAVRDMTCPPEKEKEMQMLDKLPELCRVMCSVFISERRDVLELSTVVKGLRQSIPSLQGAAAAQIEDLISLLSEKLKKWVSLVSVSSSPRRYVKLVRDAKSNVSVLLNALDESRKTFDNELRA